MKLAMGYVNRSVLKSFFLKELAFSNKTELHNPFSQSFS